ncbi:MAG TPA: hypothetical protein VMS09_15820 [Paenibacillus sp.]|uniref:hypothetical protein n=1 Tax=Paenibacillus sp. TaxID=58172 RepID=UPI0028D8C4B6|nr:hypothetical protein [Paenibacillus sp.]HUC93464.1 hypothetical protein [Paenibacillus sp.]
MFQYFELCNVVSLTPNFLLFTKNFYDNLWEENKKFPYYFQQSGGFLSNKEFQKSFEELWNEFSSQYSKINQRREFPVFDIEQLFYQKFNQLFMDSIEGQERFKEIWELFLSWWWSEYVGGKIVLEKISDWRLEQIWNELEKKIIKSPDNSVTIKYDILIIFDTPPSQVQIDFVSFHYQPISSFIPIYDQNKIVERIFNNVTGE